MISTIIAGTGSYVPKNVISNDDLSKIIDTDDNWIYSRTGIKNRHISMGENTSELAYNAALRALESSKVDKDEIDMIIVSTITPDKQMPSVACIVQAKLGAVNASAFDVSAACSGFIYGIDIADSMIKSGRVKNVLVIGSEVLSKSVDWADRGTAVLFGDGAGAVVLRGQEKSDNDSTGIISCKTYAEGDKGSCLTMEEKAVKNPYCKSDEDDRYIRMNGRDVFRFSTRVIPYMINEMINSCDISLQDISCIIPHQANSRIIDFAASKVGIEKEKFFLNLEEYGNTSSASIAIALDDAISRERIKRGDNVMLVGFGGGLTYGAILLKY